MARAHYRGAFEILGVSNTADGHICELRDGNSLFALLSATLDLYTALYSCRLSRFSFVSDIASEKWERALNRSGGSFVYQWTIKWKISSVISPVSSELNI
jgi:hypothetical protein